MVTINYDDPDLTPAGLDVGGGEIYHYQGIPFTGMLQYSFPNGNLQTEIAYVNGHPEGVWREYYLNGQIMEESYIKYNLYYGPFKEWDESGNLITESDFGVEPKDIDFRL